jgi:hypothetical protein
MFVDVRLARRRRRRLRRHLLTTATTTATVNQPNTTSERRRASHEQQQQQQATVVGHHTQRLLRETLTRGGGQRYALHARCRCGFSSSNCRSKPMRMPLTGSAIFPLISGMAVLIREATRIRSSSTTTAVAAHRSLDCVGRAPDER